MVDIYIHYYVNITVLGTHFLPHEANVTHNRMVPKTEYFQH